MAVNLIDSTDIKVVQDGSDIKLEYANLDSTTSTSSTNPIENQAITNYVNTRTTYSTSEVIIGTWVDGKPLYRKVFTISSPQSTNTNYEDLSSLNISRVIHLYGYYKNSSGTFGIPFTDSNDNFSVMFVNNANQLRGRFAASAITGMQDVKVILEYTKTTD